MQRERHYDEDDESDFFAVNPQFLSTVPGVTAYSKESKYCIFLFSVSLGASKHKLASFEPLPKLNQASVYEGAWSIDREDSIYVSTRSRKIAQMLCRSSDDLPRRRTLLPKPCSLPTG